MTKAYWPDRIYIAGPMSGIEKNNYPAFEYAFLFLRSIGLNVISPHLLCEPVDDTPKAYADVLSRDLMVLSSCTCIAFLPGSEDSRGACLEAHYGAITKKDMVLYEEISSKLLAGKELEAPIPGDIPDVVRNGAGWRGCP